jgi:hypothetical protein
MSSARVLFACLLVVASGFDKAGRQKSAFLVSKSPGDVATPDQEVMGQNMNFDELSTTMKCIINLTIQYMVIFTALGICRTYLDFNGLPFHDSPVCKALKSASETMFYAPMVCMMFVGFRMRVLQLTKGTGDPQEWVRMSMQAIAYSILVNTLLVLLVPLFTQKEIEIDSSTGELKLEGSNPFQNPVLQTVFNFVRYLTFIGLYVGFGAVCVGVFLFKPPEGIWEGPIPPVSPAVACTMILSTAFFVVYFLAAVSRTHSQYTVGQVGTSRFEEVMIRAADTLAMAPMLCVLFLGARMRALQMDPVHGNPQKWAQNCFYLCTYALIAQTLLATLVPLFLNGKASKGKMDGDVKVEIEDASPTVAKGLTALRFLLMVSLYSGLIAVVCSVFTIQHPAGKEFTPPLSPTMQCVLNLSFQYFFIYALLWIFYTVEDFVPNLMGDMLYSVRDAIESAKSTVQFAPMLCILFIATRMRALQITQNRGAPQGWVQDAMYLASWSVMIQFVMCLVMPVFTGKKYEPDNLDGPPAKSDELDNPIGAAIVSIVRYTALLALIGGVATVITGVIVMTPETANGRGAIPLIADGTLPVNMAPSPPGVNDVPGAKDAMEATGKSVGTGVNNVHDGAQKTAEGVAL